MSWSYSCRLLNGLTECSKDVQTQEALQLEAVSAQTTSNYILQATSKDMPQFSYEQLVPIVVAPYVKRPET